MRKSITIEVATLNEQCCNQENILKGSKKSRGLLSIIFLYASFFYQKGTWYRNENNISSNVK